MADVRSVLNQSPPADSVFRQKRNTMENIPKLRFAHPTDNLERSIFFYRDGLGFEILYRYT